MLTTPSAAEAYCLLPLTTAKGRLVATLSFEALLCRAIEAREKDRLQAEQAVPRDKLPPAAFTAVVRSIAGFFPQVKTSRVLRVEKRKKEAGALREKLSDKQSREYNIKSNI